jgi:hypothetical protein
MFLVVSKRRNNMKYLLIILLFVITMVTVGEAQETFTVTAPATDSKVTAEIIASSSTKVIKGAPFSAEAVSESVQTLPDSNRITRSTTTKMYRDGEGRFRREGTGGGGSGAGAVGYGGLVSAYGFQDTISINDPVEGVRYILTPNLKTARRFDLKNKSPEGGFNVNAQAMSKTQIEKSLTTTQSANIVVLQNAASGTGNIGKTEQLGNKTIEGVETLGSRTVTTIAAGTVGNEKPIEIVYERWYSKELDLIVYSRHYDPRFGEQIYRLTSINRSEPDRSLFTVPSDFKLVSESPFKLYTTKPE